MVSFRNCDKNDADDLALLANNPAQAETFLHNLERAERGIGQKENTDKTEFIYFKQDRVNSTLIAMVL